MASTPADGMESLNQRRRRAVEMRLAGESLAAIRVETGLSAPTVISAHKAFLAGGWPAVPVRSRGRVAGQGRRLLPGQEEELREAIFTTCPADHALTSPLWSLAEVQAFVRTRFDVDLAESTVQRHLVAWGLDPVPLRESRPADPVAQRWLQEDLPRHLNRARARRERIVRVGLLDVAPQGTRVLCVVGLRGRPAWLPLAAPNQAAAWTGFLTEVAGPAAGPVCILLHGIDVARDADLSRWIADQGSRLRVVACPVGLGPGPGPGRKDHTPARTNNPVRKGQRAVPPDAGKPARNALNDRGNAMTLTHLQRLEAEAIHIMREVVAEAERPVMLYSIGKDSACMLRLAQKAFHPAVPPFPLLHVDTTWKFREMYELRDKVAKETGMELLVYKNPEGEAKGINPFDHGSQIHTDIWKTQGLKQALDKYGFDAAFGGARRDEEKSRAKERIFSFRNAQHRWDPKAQRPELWHLYNSRKLQGESIRVFPLSNWTELDVWQYIHLENIPIVPLYFAKERPVVERDGTWIMVDDERMPLKPGEVPVMRKIRFRTLGCYPLSGGVDSQADTVPGVIQEMLLARTSERQGRLIDHDQSASMEKKKQEGYF